MQIIQRLDDQKAIVEVITLEDAVNNFLSQRPGRYIVRLSDDDEYVIQTFGPDKKAATAAIITSGQDRLSANDQRELKARRIAVANYAVDELIAKGHPEEVAA